MSKKDSWWNTRLHLNEGEACVVMTFADWNHLIDVCYTLADQEGISEKEAQGWIATANNISMGVKSSLRVKEEDGWS